MYFSRTFSITAVALTLAASSVASDNMKWFSASTETRLFDSVIKLAGLEPGLAGDKPFTLFVPSDAAFENERSANLIEGVYATPGNRDRLTDLIGYHIVPDRKLLFTSNGQRDFDTKSGEPLSISVNDDEIILNGHVRVIETIDLGAGVAYVTSGLLWADLAQEKSAENVQARSAPIN